MPYAFRRGFVLVTPIVSLLLGTSACGTKAERDEHDDHVKRQWLNARSAEEHRELVVHLNGDRSRRFDDGWYTTEHERDGGGAWRWMGHHAIVRMQVPAKPADMKLSLYGWVPYGDMQDARTLQMQIAVEGHVLDTFFPPRGNFKREVLVPRAVLGEGGLVDVGLTVSNTVRPPGDWRDLGFATTGIFLAPADPP